MKRYSLLGIVSVLLLMIGCVKDGVSYEDSITGNVITDYGYLILPDVVYVDLTSETFNQNEATSQTESLASAAVRSITKSDDLTEASDDYLVTITNTAVDTIAYESSYGELKSLEQLALRPASYSIYVRSTDDVPGVGSEAHFSGSSNFVIVASMLTTLDNLSCKMNNIKTSITMSADMLDLFQPDSETTPTENLNVQLSIGDNEANYNRDNNGAINYFKALDVTNTLEIVLSGMYNMAAENEEPSYVMIEGWKQSISGVKAGQWRNISINVDHANQGTVDFTITIDMWTYDEQIDVDTTDSVFQMSFGESELDDPENYITDAYSPSVTLGESESDLTKAFYIDQSSFSLNSSLQAICVDPLILNAEPINASVLSELWIEFTSDNDSFNEYLEKTFGSKRRDYILSSGVVSSNYTMSGNSFTASYDMMYQLYLYSGVHTATIMAKDDDGRASYNTLVMISSNDGVDIPQTSAPTITWRGGKDFDTRYVVDSTAGLEVIIDITSESGITGFTLEINSDVLTPEELAGINLSSEMDLINPGDCEAGLVYLGFPVGDAVEGQTSMVFDITSFMPMLVVTGSGDSDFVLHVTDAGGTTSQTLMVRVE